MIVHVSYIYDTVSDIPDIIIVQVFEFLFSHLTCVPFLSVVAVKLKLVVSPGLLTLTRAAVNPVLPTLLTCPVFVTVAIWYDGGEYQSALLPVIVQVTSPCVCGHTPWLQSILVTWASTFTIRNKLQILYYNILTHLW